MFIFKHICECFFFTLRDLVNSIFSVPVLKIVYEVIRNNWYLDSLNTCTKIKLLINKLFCS